MINVERRMDGKGVRGAKVAAALAAACLALLFSACSAGSEKSGTSAGTHPATQPTTTTGPAEPVVEPITPAERQWVKRMHKIRPRIDTAFQRTVSITRASMQSLVRVLGFCRTTLKEAGRPSERFAHVAEMARTACDRYETAADRLEQAISVSDVGGAVLAGSPEEAVFGDSLDHAFAAQGNGSNTMLRAEEKAEHVLDTIEAQQS
jgi:predicted trehalose synthase